MASIVRRVWTGLSSERKATLIVVAGWGAIGTPGAVIVAMDERRRGISIMKSAVRGSLFGVAWPLTYLACLAIWIWDD